MLSLFYIFYICCPQVQKACRREKEVAIVFFSLMWAQ